MEPNNIVDLTAWAGPSGVLVDLCDQATALFAHPSRPPDATELIRIAQDLMSALGSLDALPPPGGAIGRAVEVLTHVDAHPHEDVLDAIAQLRRVSTMSATSDSASPEQPSPTPRPCLPGLEPTSDGGAQ